MKMTTNRDARILGVLFFLAGLGLGYWQIYTPIAKALRGDTYINYYTEGVALAPLIALVGLFTLVFGAKGALFLQSPPSKALLVTILVVVMLITLGCLFGMEWIMKSLGYS